MADEETWREQINAWRETVSRDGAHATREYVVPWALKGQIIPKIGTAYATGSKLYCSEYTIEGVGKPAGYDTNGLPKFTHARVRIEYNTHQNIDAAPIINWSVSAEALETGLGRRWETAGTICDQAQSVLYPQAELTMTRTTLSIPQTNMINLVGKVNWRGWQGFPAETLLFLGGDTEARFDYERNRYVYTVALKFLFRPISHNIVWRAPRQARDATGALMWGDDSTQQDPVFVTGPAGVGGWDRPIPPLYAFADFNPLIGLPPQVVPCGANDPNAGIGGQMRLT